MTKRALIVIAIVIILPVIVTLVAVDKYYKGNAVVAEYDGSIEVISYDGLKLYMVKSAEGYNFRFGEYLGKIGNAITGASLYRVKGDDTGSYYAIADGAKKILFTESGELIDGVRIENSRVTRVVFDDFLIEENNEEKIELIVSPSGNKVSVDMSNYQEGYKYYDLYLSFDSSAIVTEYFGRLIKLTEKDRWVYISPEACEAAKEEYGKNIAETVYVATLIDNDDLVNLLDSYFEKTSAESTSKTSK